MSEANMWAYLQPRLKPHLHAERITERLHDGVADVVYVARDGRTGWLELKYLPKYPENMTCTPLLTYGSHGLQTAQAFWLGRWARKGGRAGILLRVGSADWWYWRAPPRTDWTQQIQETWANFHATAAWSATVRLRPPQFPVWDGDFTIHKLVTALCE